MGNMRIRLRRSSFFLKEEELDNVFYYADYYKTLGAREICHRFKDNDPEAISIMAIKMARFINIDDSIIPVPSRTGKATNTLELAYAISDITGAEVYDIVEGKARTSIYYAKKRGDDLNSIDFGYRLKGSIPSNPVIIDGVMATGTTLKNIQNLIPNSKIVVYAKTISKLSD
jgi:predicted amidophosphoribosyltransferase